MKLPDSNGKKITKEKNGENAPRLEVTEVVLVHCNLDNYSYQHDSKVLYTFITNKPFGSLIDILPATFMFLKTLKSRFLLVDVWSTDQNSEPLE